MAKQIKLTEKVWWKLKLRAEQDGLTLAGEIQKLLDAETLPDLIERLEQAVGRLEQGSPAMEEAETVKEKQGGRLPSGVDWGGIAKKMGYDI